MSIRTMTAVSITATLAACGGVAGDTAWAGTVRDSGGVQIVENPAAGVWRAGEGWELAEDLRIGMAEGEPEYQFGAVQGLVVDAMGRVLVLDQQAQEVRVFGSDGSYESSFGRPGGGPGEIGAGSSGLFAGGGDTLYLIDAGNQRVELFLTDGAFLSSYRLDFSSGIPLRWDETADGSLVGQFRLVAFPGMDVEPDSLDRLVASDPDGTPSDTLMLFPSGTSFDFSGGRPSIRLFVSEPWWTLAEGGTVYYGQNGEFRIGRYGTNGALEQLITKPFVAQPVDDEDQAITIESLERLWRRFAVPPQAIAAMKDGISFAEHYPAYAQFWAGPDGSLWVQQVQRATDLGPEERESYNPQSDIGGRDWDVFDADGRYLGVVQTPPRFQMFRWVDDVAYGVVRDDLDVQYVVRLRLIRTNPAAD